MATIKNIQDRIEALRAENAEKNAEEIAKLEQFITELKPRIAALAIFQKQVEAIQKSPTIERVYETAALCDFAGQLDSWPSFLEKIFQKPSFEEFQGAKTKVRSKIQGALKNHEAKTA